MDTKPLKRHSSLLPLSHEHHHGLQLCWKIRTGFKKNIELPRIEKYVAWFSEEHLFPHFEIEEKYIFPILDKNNDLIKRALSEHRKIKRLLKSDKELNKKLSLFEENLERHIRFEERVLFNEIQSVATSEQLKQIQLHHSDMNFTDNLTDSFWK